MIKIDVVFNNSELAGKLRRGVYELPEGSTVAALMAEAQNEAAYVISQELTDNIVFLFDNRHAAFDTELKDGGKLRVLHKVLGG